MSNGSVYIELGYGIGMRDDGIIILRGINKASNLIIILLG